MQFKVKCPSEPPRRPNGTVETNVVSLYVCSQTPKKLQRGINLVTLCLSLAFFAGASNFIGNQGNATELAASNRSIEGLGEQFWLTHSDQFLSDDLFVVPGPVNINPITYGILPFRQLRGGGGGGFLARIQKTRLQLTD